jgi:4-hydroxy-4-methyl-2-oxoglutarate aldolase
VSKSHPEQWMIREAVERPEKSLVTALREFAATQVADCDGPVAVVAPPLRHLAGGAQLCGPAVTVWTKPGDILYVLKAVDLIAAGDVLVVDGGGRLDAAVIGDIAGQALAGLGCAGLVVDGAVRDLDGLDAAGLPTFAAGAHPATGSNQGPGAINVVVQCGGVTVRPGDVVRGGTRSARSPITASIAMTLAAISAAAKPPGAPTIFTAQPAAAAAAAEPAALAEFSQTKAWVSTARSTAASASTELRTRLRGIASPVSATPNPSSSSELAASNGRQPIASPAAAAASCTRGAVRHWRSPYSQPASRLAPLDTMNSAAAAAAAPCSTADAVTEICMAPNNPPMARFTPARTANPGRSSERPLRCRPAVPAAGGAVRRCAAKHNPPATTKAAASTVPAAG